MKKEILLFAISIILCVAIVSSCEKESKNLPQSNNFSIAPPPSITIGQNFGGGIVFYIDSTGRHGLIVSKVNQSFNIPWSNNNNSIVTHATGTGVGWGRENTKVIVNIQGQGTYAASICDNLDISGYDDWYLPSKDELHLLYQQKASGKINLPDDFYWSSTEASQNDAWSQSFSNGANSSTDKHGNYSICAIRIF